MTPRSTSKVEVIGQRSKKRFICNVGGLWSQVRFKGHVGQGQPIGHDISRWAHVNVKLHFFKFFFFTLCLGTDVTPGPRV